MDWYPYLMSPSINDWMPYDLLGRSAPFVHKPISKEARMALKRKRKQVKKSRKANR